MIKRFGVAFLTVLLTLSALPLAAGELPPAKWWRRSEIVQSLGINEEQQTRLDKIFRAAANELIDLRAEVDKQTIALRGALDQPQLDRGKIQAIAAKLNEGRSRLFQRELMMLVDMRSVLTVRQWNQMREQLENLGTRPQRQGRRNK